MPPGTVYNPLVKTGPIYAFGPFQLDEGARRLVSGPEPVAVSDRQIDILLFLVSRSGQIVSKDALIQAAWKNVAVGDNSLEQAISGVRRLLGAAPDGSPYIETLARRGYRFNTPVTRLVARQSDAALDAVLAPYRIFVEGRAAVETLRWDAVSQARAAFGDLVAGAPDYAPGHVGLANALAFAFDSTRADDAPDAAALVAAVHHAREACRLDPAYGEAWATLGFVLSRTGAGTEAVAAGRHALALEPDNWRHYLRVAYSAWGEERLRAADRALRLLPRLALAHWLAGTVHIARQAFDDARRALATGAAAQDQLQDGDRFGGVGLHLLWGLVALATDDITAAEVAFDRELAAEAVGHIYTRQAAANTWCAIGAVRLGQSRTAEAAAAFEHALQRVPGHPLVLAAMTVVADRGRRVAIQSRLDGRLATLRMYERHVEVAMVTAVVRVLAGRHAEAAADVSAALQAAPPGSSAGWTLPVEPLLQVATHPVEWAAALSTLRSRAA